MLLTNTKVERPATDKYSSYFINIYKLHLHSSFSPDTVDEELKKRKKTFLCENYAMLA